MSSGKTRSITVETWVMVHRTRFVSCCPSHDNVMVNWSQHLYNLIDACFELLAQLLNRYPLFEATPLGKVHWPYMRVHITFIMGMWYSLHGKLISGEGWPLHIVATFKRR